MRRAILSAAACGLVLVVAATSAVARATSGPAVATVSGKGEAVFPAGIPVVGGDTEEVSVKARLAPDGSVKGHFHVIHHLAAGGISGDVRGDVTCLTVVGNTARLSGVITKGRLPGVPGVDPIGEEVALTIVDNGGADLLGVDSSFAPFPHEVGECGPVDPFLAVSGGDFTVNQG